MIVSVHLADVGPRKALSIFRKGSALASVPGLTYAEPTVVTDLNRRLLPTPKPGRVGLIAAWEDDGALEDFGRAHPLAAPFTDGWEVRLQPLRVFGAWAGMPGLPSKPLPHEDEEPVVVLTLGRPRLHRALPFLRSAAAAEGRAAADPALVASAGLGHPPRLVSTFSIWRSAVAMREYATGAGGPHHAAVQSDRAKPFHHESAFVRFRPYASRGSWDGRDPLSGLIGSRAL